MFSDVTSASAPARVEKGPPGTMKNYTGGSMSISFTSKEAEKGMRCDTNSSLWRFCGYVSMVWRTEEMWWNVRSIFFSSSVLTFFSLPLLSFPVFITSSAPSLSPRVAPFPLLPSSSYHKSLPRFHPFIRPSSDPCISITNPPFSSTTLQIGRAHV